MKASKKLFYDDQYLKTCKAVVVEIKNESGIVLDQTIAFPEGGGQESDQGSIELIIKGERISIPFIHVQKAPGRSIFLQDFPVIQVSTPIIHHIDERYYKYFQVGMDVVVKLDVNRRENLTVSHTGTHIALMGIEKMYPDVYSKIFGCHIKEGESRLDFNIEEKLTNDDIEKIEYYANEIVEKDIPIQVFQHAKEPEAWYWKCEDTIYPCGGTHLNSTKYTGTIKVKKKNLGKNKQRLIFSFPSAILQLDKYHM